MATARNIRKHAGYNLRKEKKKNHNDSRQTEHGDCRLTLTGSATHPAIDLVKAQAEKQN
jgi:hypothetical protein